MKTLLLIDANALIHRAFHALPPMHAPDGRPTHALYGVASIMLKLWREAKPDYAAALFDRPEPTFRKEAFKEYKAHRPEAPDELIDQIVEARRLFEAFGIPVFESPGFEADDGIGTLAEKFGKESALRVEILTGDLDALQLVRGERTVVRTLKTGVSETVVYGEREVQERYGLPPKTLPDYKALVGDASDNIPGIPGVGPKTAATLLTRHGTLETLFADLAQEEEKIRKKLEGKKKDAFLYRELATIRTDAPFDTKKLSDLAVSDRTKNLTDYFLPLGFESLVKRMNGKAAAPHKVSQDTGTLFAAPSSEPPPAGMMGFDIKEKIKAHKAKSPYVDLGVGFWLLNPDLKNYSPENIFKKFLKREWSGTEEDNKFAHRSLYDLLKKEGLIKVFEKIEMPLIDVLAAMELRGIRVDARAQEALRAELKGRVDDLRKELARLAGDEINFNSPKQLSALLFEKLGIGGAKGRKTATGQRSTDVKVLKNLKDEHPIIAPLLEYRELFKLLSTYVEPLQKLIGSDGRVHTTYVQTGTATGRLSSENPNMQNIPAQGVWGERVRAAFVAEKGYEFAALDYSQIELRIVATLSGDHKMTEAFRHGEDIHTTTAATVLGVSHESVTPDMRRLAKTLNFGIVYGMGARAFSETAEIPLQEAKDFIKNYFEQFPGVRVWHERLKEEARKTGMVKNENGRRRLVPAIRYGVSRAAAEAERIVINMPVQSLAADIIKYAMLKTEEYIEGNGLQKDVRLLLSIHDELLFEVRSDIITEVGAELKNIMESVYALKTPLIVNLKRGGSLSSLL